MAWTDQVFRYCERGADPAFWAEPLNAVSNAAFLAAALVAGYEVHRRGAREPVAAWGLVAIVFVIGVGSFLFHTFATRWAAMADVAPIGLFMLVYLGYATRSFLGLGWIGAALAVALFVWTSRTMGTVSCQDLASAAPFLRAACRGGTLGYAPAFAAIVAAGAAAAIQRRPAALYLGAAAIVFLASMSLRATDIPFCAQTEFFGRPRGTHALWHLFNAATLYILLLAAIRHGGGRGAIASRSP